MVSLYFPKPQPLSPNTTAYMKDDLRYYRKQKGREVLVKGVEQTQSIYYWWFHYLLRSDKYKTACANNGKGMKKLYNDFGNIFDYEFWNWWTERGQQLFGIKPIQQVADFTTVDEVLENKEQIENGNIKLVALPTNLTKATLQRRLSKILKELEVKPTAEQKADYFIEQSKVDVDSLRDCLIAYDLKQQGYKNVEIGGQFLVAQDELDELVRDGREKSKTFEFDALSKFISKRNMSIEQYDELIAEGKGVFFIGGEERTATKNYLNVKANRMIAKAKKNIEAVEKGTFGVGHLEQGNR